jgi:chaperonin cofactor prefoldin
MSLRREQLERQLQNAETAIAEYSKVLDEQNVPADARKKHPKWKQINAQKTQVKNRLKSLKVIEDREAAIKAASAEAGE